MALLRSARRLSKCSEVRVSRAFVRVSEGTRTPDRLDHNRDALDSRGAENPHDCRRIGAFGSPGASDDSARFGGV